MSNVDGAAACRWDLWKVVRVRDSVCDAVADLMPVKFLFCWLFGGFSS